MDMQNLKNLFSDEKIFIPTLISAWGAYQLGNSIKSPDPIDIIIFIIFIGYFIKSLMRIDSGERKYLFGVSIVVLAISLIVLILKGISFLSIAAVVSFSVIALTLEVYQIFVTRYTLHNDNQAGLWPSHITCTAFLVGIILAFN